jgi:hypothetical protein
MNRKILSLLLITVLSLSLFGCGEDEVSMETEKTRENRFIYTDDRYNPGMTYDSLYVFYDTKTNIVYLATGGNGGGITPLLNKDKQPMTIDEYNASK